MGITFVHWHIYQISWWLNDMNTLCAIPTQLIPNTNGQYNKSYNGFFIVRILSFWTNNKGSWNWYNLTSMQRHCNVICVSYYYDMWHKTTQHWLCVLCVWYQGRLEKYTDDIEILTAERYVIIRSILSYVLRINNLKYSLGRDICMGYIF